MATIANALPELRAAEGRLRALAASRGLIYAIADFGGVRSQADTAKAMQYRDDDYAVYLRQFRAKYGMARTPLDKFAWRPINAFGASHHNFGAAFDALMIKGTLAELGTLAPSVGLVWGGSFQRKDFPHFQLPMTLNDAKARWLALGNLAGVSKSTPALVAVALVGVVAALFARGLRAW